MIRDVVPWLLATATIIHASNLRNELQRQFDQPCQSQKFMGAASLTVNGKTLTHDSASPRMHYGYGIVLAERFGHKLQYHSGGISGYNSTLQRYPVIAVLSNVDSDSGVLPTWTLGDGLAKIWFEATRI